MGNQQTGSARQWRVGDRAVIGSVRVELIERHPGGGTTIYTVPVWTARLSTGGLTVVAEEDLREISPTDDDPTLPCETCTGEMVHTVGCPVGDPEPAVDAGDVGSERMNDHADVG